MSDSSEKTASPSTRPRKRAPHTRSRLGCRTCRARHIRCDLARPACHRCTSTGRTCDGYPAVSPMGRGSASASASSVTTWAALRPQATPSLLGGGDDVDLPTLRSLHYFHRVTKRQLPGPVASEFWDSLVLRLSVRERCVRELAAALGMLDEASVDAHRRRGRHSRGRSPPGGTSPGALDLPAASVVRQYDKAVRALNAHISASCWDQLEITLTGCILCILFEWIQGDLAAAQIHLRGALNILSQWERSHGSGSPIPGGGTSYTSPSGDFIRHKLLPMFVRMMLQWCLFSGTAPAWNLARLLPGPDAIHTLEEARDALHLLLFQILDLRERFARTRGRQSHPPSSIAALRREQTTYTTALNQWSRSFASLRPPSSSSPTTLLLTLTHTLSTLLLTTALCSSETTYDTHLPTFQSLLRSARTLLASLPATPSGLPDDPRAPVSLDLGLVPLLAFVVLKCRDPSLRREALGLLERYPRREGLWDGRAAAVLGGWVVGVEESGVGDAGEGCWPKEEDRVCRVDFGMDLQRRVVRVRCLRGWEVEMEGMGMEMGGEGWVEFGW